MSHFAFQFFALLLAAILFASWQRQNRPGTAPVRNGFHVVRWPLMLQLVNGVFFIVILVMSAHLQWATDESVPFPMWVLVIIVLALSSFGAFTWRARIEYNETAVIAFPMIGRPRNFAFGDFTRAGPANWRGHQFSTETGDKIYVNSYQTGGPALIELLQRQKTDRIYGDTQ